jgi:hypothetical protein
MYVTIRVVMPEVTRAELADATNKDIHRLFTIASKRLAAQAGKPEPITTSKSINHDKLTKEEAGKLVKAGTAWLKSMGVNVPTGQPKKEG